MCEKTEIKPFDKELPSEYADRLGICYSIQVSQKHKKENGQFFTPIPIANLMASMSNANKSNLKILDPGCGTGILTCSLIENLIVSKSKVKSIELVLYETDQDLVALTNNVLSYLKKWLKLNGVLLSYSLLELGIPIDQHSKLPDVVIYDTERKWLFLIEAVTSHGPISPKRIFELENLLQNCPIGKVYVTAFPDMSEFKKHSKNIAWETEVWLMDIPDHMIHFNGDRFMGPR